MAKLVFKRTGDDFEHLISDVTEISCAGTGFLAYAFQAYTVVDYDGAPNSYGSNRPGDPLQVGLHPKEKHLANATHPWPQFPNGVFEWVGVVAATKAYARQHQLKIDDRYCGRLVHHDKHGHLDAASLNLGAADAALGAYPVVQTTGDTRGYYVPHTNKVRAGDPWDPTIYANPLTLPMMVRTGAWKSKHARIGDFGFAADLSLASPTAFAFGDSNPSKHVGEMSAFLHQSIGLGVKSQSKAIYVGFPKSGKSSAREGSLIGATNASIDAGVREQMAKLSLADNRMDLVDFLICGADIDVFEAFKAGSSVSKADLVHRKAKYARLMGPLLRLGFPMPISDFKAGFSPANAA